MSELGISQGTAQNVTSPVLKFRHNNKIKFITQKIIRRSTSWFHTKDQINIYDGTPITLNGVNYKVRFMRGWGQVSANSNGTGAPNYETGPLFTVNLSFGTGGNSGVN